MVRYFVINMDKDIENFITLQKTCKEDYDITVERIQGVDISKMSDKEKKNLTTPYIYKYGTNGMIGCFLAHRNVWKKVVEENIDYAVVFEDDIIMDKSIKKMIEKVLNNKYRFDIMLLGCRNGCKNPKDYNMSDLISKIALFKYNKKYKLFDDNVHIPEFFTGTHAYIITNKSAKKLLKLFPKVSGPVDSELSKKIQVKKISINNNIVKQNSDISTNNTSKTEFLLDKLLLNRIYINEDKPLSYSLNVVHLKFHKVPITQRYMLIVLLFLISILLLKNHFNISIIIMSFAILMLI